MAGVTNAPFRRLCRRFGGGLYVSEMVMARAYLEGNERTARMVAFAPDERPRSLQLYGVDPADVGEAVARLTGVDGVDHIDLNFGCPAAKVTRKGGGAAIPARPALLAAIVRAAVRAAAPAGVPVTVKFRLGIDDSLPTSLTTGRIAEDEGAAAVALHARTAEQHYAGPADWAAIAALKEHVRSIPVLGNGDVFEGADGPRMMAETGCDGIVVGRGCLGRPWLFRDLSLAFAGEPVPPPPPLGEVAAVLADARPDAHRVVRRGARLPGAAQAHQLVPEGVRGRTRHPPGAGLGGRRRPSSTTCSRSLPPDLPARPRVRADGARAHERAPPGRPAGGLARPPRRRLAAARGADLVVSGG